MSSQDIEDFKKSLILYFKRSYNIDAETAEKMIDESWLMQQLQQDPDFIINGNIESCAKWIIEEKH